MSAYIVDHDHIDALLSYGIEHDVRYVVRESNACVNISRTNATEIGRILLDENERTVRYEGKLVGDELHIGRRTRPDAPLTEMIATRAPAGEGALPARIEPPALHNNGTGSPARAGPAR